MAECIPAPYEREPWTEAANLAEGGTPEGGVTSQGLHQNARISNGCVRWNDVISLSLSLFISAMHMLTAGSAGQVPKATVRAA